MTCPFTAFSPFLLLLLPAAFISGSIPFGVLFTRGRGIDLRSTGSKNIGATNVLRSAGKIPAVLTLICDMLKGALPLVICRLVIANMHGAPHTGANAVVMEDIWLGAAGLAAVLGHMFSVFLSFRGGKGVATGFGVLLVFSPAVAGIMLLVWILTAIVFRYSSLAAIIAVAVMPLMLFLSGASAVKTGFGVLIAALIIWKHIPNIKKLISGTESKIGKKG